MGEKAGEKDQKREEREAEAGIYHVAACSPSLPGAQPRDALPKSYFLIWGALSGFRASPLLPSFQPLLRGSSQHFGDYIIVSLLWRLAWMLHAEYVQQRKSVLWLHEKQHLVSCSNFIGCLSESGKPRARAVILASEAKKKNPEKDVGKHKIVHRIVGEGDISWLLLTERKVGIISEPLVYHPWMCLCRSEISARDRTFPRDSQNNSKEKKASCWSG